MDKKSSCTVESSGEPAIDAATLPPLVVDLDGTLIRSNLLVESMFALVRDNFLSALLMPLWLSRGKAALKSEIAKRVTLDVSTLPYNGPFVEFLGEQRRSGRRLLLATASNRKFAHQVAEHLQLFDEVLASDELENLSGRTKLEGILDRVRDDMFDYAGNSAVDIPIWEHSREALVVRPSLRARRWYENSDRRKRLFQNGPYNSLGTYVRALRPHQWLKNLLLFVPLVMAHQVHDLGLLSLAALAFVAFGLCASSVYLLNDLIDLGADRQHTTKRNRPIAAGDIPLVHVLFLVPALLVASGSTCLLLPWEFSGVLLLYYLSTLAYSLYLKRTAVVDVIVLASLYTLRIIAGAAAVAVHASFWLLAFSMFLFLSLALVKRYTELRSSELQGTQMSPGRGYRAGDLEGLAQLGNSSAIGAVVVLALYVNSEAVKQMYSHPHLIWLLCPLLLYLMGRIWLLARRNELHEDPVVFVVQDRCSQAMAVIGALLLWLAH